MVVFLALPALQNSQKDTARKQDVARVVAALQNYMADHQGSLSSLDTGVGHSATISDSPSLIPYLGTLATQSNVWIDSNQTQYHAAATSIDVYLGKTCAPAGSTTMPVSTGDAAVVVKLSSGNYYCASM